MRIERFQIFAAGFRAKADQVATALASVARAAGKDEVVQIVAAAVASGPKMIARARVRERLRRHPLSAMEAMPARPLESRLERRSSGWRIGRPSASIQPHRGSAMMDVGFGSVIEKFEQHYGSQAAKALLGLIALAIVAACIAIIWQWLVSPVLTFFKSPERLRLLIQLLYLGLGIGFGSVVARLSARRWSREGREIRVELNNALERNRQAAEGLESAVEDLGRTLSENDTRLLLLDKNSTPEHLRKLAQQLQEEAAALEAKAR